MNYRPLLRLAVHLWHRVIPFRLFRDAGHGSIEQRIANYRYNRLNRAILPSFILKWMGICAFLMASLHILSNLMGQTLEGSGIYVCMVTLCATAGIAFTFSCVVVTLLTVCYLFLSRADY
jgi:hypothetical protein